MSPLIIGLAVTVLVVAVATAIATVVGTRRRRRADARAVARPTLAPDVPLTPATEARAKGPRLPQGADAALWSIVEAVPDPRNHLALTRDLTGEVRLTPADRSLIEALGSRGEAPAPGAGARPAAATAAPGIEVFALTGRSYFTGTPPHDQP